ncbi:MAG: biotin-dependent carboxyltransferase [Acidobacteria bacterium]|nr:biotin-dependent carboxyltransferase [Acidobacteriota bacterium]
MILVESAGLLTTVQDLGRPGYGEMGVSACGAGDPVALRIANTLVGNRPGAAALEMTMIGGRYRFDIATVAAVTGAECPVRLNGAPAPQWAAFEVPAGGMIEVAVATAGARMYLAAAGGIDVPLALGSASTHLTAGIGGLDGRALRKGDRLALGIAERPALWRALRRETLARLGARKTLRVTAAPQTAWFTDEQRALLVSSAYRVTQEVNRLGLRLDGAPLACPGASNMITEGAALGTVQVPAGGQPIILFVEQQTTGGYPKIANVIAADLPSVGQLRPGDEVRFEWVGFETARALLREQESLMAHGELFAE